MRRCKERRKWCICIPRVRSFVQPATNGIESETFQTLGLYQHQKKKSLQYAIRLSNALTEFISEVYN